MSRTKEEKKRKRNEEAVAGAGAATKKSKKSETSEISSDAPQEPSSAEVNREKSKNDKKSKRAEELVEITVSEEPSSEAKKPKKSKKSKPAKDTGPGEAELIQEMKASENFISINDDAPIPESGDKPSKKKKQKFEKADKKPKKEKRSKTSEQAVGIDAPVTEAILAAEEGQGLVVEDTAAADGTGEKSEPNAVTKKKLSKEKKKDKKAKKAKKKAENQTNGENPAQEQPGEDVPAANGDIEQLAEEEAIDDEAGGIALNSERNQDRFIVFVGNLPYSATKEQIEEHFAKLQPADIRMRTYKGPNGGTKKFMGTCFIEFDRFDRMKTCLAKYHHSLFPDGKKKSEGRKINVELSAGGGGNSENRKSKILAKNEKLNEERARHYENRAELEMKRGERKEKKESRQKKTDQEEEAASEEAAEPDHGGIHPARLAMMSRPTPFTHRKRFKS